MPPHGRRGGGRGRVHASSPRPTEEFARPLRAARGTPAGPGRAADPPDAHRINRVRQDDRNRLGRVLDGERGRGRGGDDEVELESNELRRKLRKPLRQAFRVPTLHEEILSLDVPEVSELLKEAFLNPHGRHGDEADSPYLLGLLCFGDEGLND